MFAMRFDMRAPANGAPAPELYRAALEMCAWGEERGALGAVFCEHHGSADGYLPAPLAMAAAAAARTTKLPITVAIIQLPLYDPIRLAEEMCVIDNLSGGRVSVFGAVGYVPSEYEMCGVDFHRRGAIAEEKLQLLLRAKTGEAFEHEGRRIHVTPPPLTPGGPRFGWGGGSLPAAKRAGRYGLDFMTEKNDPALQDAYETSCREHGHKPGLLLMPKLGSASTIFVADDVDAAWAEVGPFIMNDVLGYGAWNAGRVGTHSISFAKTIEQLRAENLSHRVVTVAEAIELVRGGSPLSLHPIIGGLPPKIAWRYLETVATKVLPAL